MGTKNHNAILATTWNEEEVARIIKWVESLKSDDSYLFLFGPATINHQITVIMVPDGSKEGWAESDAGDVLRKNFIAEIEKGNYEDNSSPWDWIEVGYGEYGQKILNGNCKNCYSDKDYEDDI